MTGEIKLKPKAWYEHTDCPCDSDCMSDGIEVSCNIDKKIRYLVRDFNLAGLKTRNSCAGHAYNGYAYIQFEEVLPIELLIRFIEKFNTSTDYQEENRHICNIRARGDIKNGYRSSRLFINDANEVLREWVELLAQSV